MMAEESGAKYSEPEYAKANQDNSKYPWYRPDISKYIVPETKKLLETYSKIPPEEHRQHVNQIRDQAWAIRTYPCTGLGVFLMPNIPRSVAYQTILERLKAGGKYLDVGCFLGVDMRQLVLDGVPSNQLYGIDIVSHWEVGYFLFRDKDRFKGHFTETDVLAENSALKAMEGEMDVVSVFAVLHQWPWATQVEALKRLTALTRKAGAIVLGCHIGNDKAGNVKVPGAGNASVWRHSPDSMTLLWEQVGEETGTKWKSEATLLSHVEAGLYAEDMAWLNEGDRMMDFVATRLE